MPKSIVIAGVFASITNGLDIALVFKRRSYTAYKKAGNKKTRNSTSKDAILTGFSC